MPVIVARDIDSVTIEELALRPMGDTDVRVRIDATGICHSDMSVVNGDMPGRTPLALGHEATGTVIDCGRGVSRVRVGQRVVLAAIPGCGYCWFCSRGESHLCSSSPSIRKPSYLDGDRPLGGLAGLGTFSDMMVVDERVAVPVTTDLPAELLALIGCAVLTGTGSTINTAGLSPADSVAVIGAGGIGLSAIQGARAAGASPIVAIDPSASARHSATGSGATHTCAPGPDATTLVNQLTDGRGVDAVIDCVGNSATFSTAWDLTRRGGQIVLVGVAPPSQTSTVPLVELAYHAKRIVGCVYGSSSVQRDIPRFVAMAERGQLDFSALLGRLIAFDHAPTVLRGLDPHPGRSVIRF
jgi:S-(hydroxymethyl)glutathione dehydrogenase/alcohol dehydrogenase